MVAFFLFFLVFAKGVGGPGVRAQPDEFDCARTSGKNAKVKGRCVYNVFLLS